LAIVPVLNVPATPVTDIKLDAQKDYVTLNANGPPSFGRLDNMTPLIQVCTARFASLDGYPLQSHGKLSGPPPRGGGGLGGRSEFNIRGRSCHRLLSWQLRRPATLRSTFWMDLGNVVRKLTSAGKAAQRRADAEAMRRPATMRREDSAYAAARRVLTKPGHASLHLGYSLSRPWLNNARPEGPERSEWRLQKVHIANDPARSWMRKRRS